MVSSLKLEFLFLYFFLPSLLAVISSTEIVFLTLYTVFIISLLILKNKIQFNFSILFKKIDWRFTFKCFILFSISGYIYTLIINPEMLFNLPRNNFKLWIMVLFFYPFLSVIPQEFIYRVLFFERYFLFFKNRKYFMIIANLVVFSYGHIVFHNFHALLITSLASPIFAFAYLKKSFLTCVIVHSIGGQLIFTFGLGEFFY